MSVELGQYQQLATQYYKERVKTKKIPNQGLFLEECLLEHWES